MSAPAQSPAREAFSEAAGYRFRALPVLAVALLATATGLLPLPLAATAQRTLVILVVAGGLWVTESLPVAATALLIPILGIALGVAPARAAFAGFGDPIVFLFLGTFLLTGAAERHGLNARLAAAVLGSRWVAAHPVRLLWAVAALGCGLSAWVNNTATTALLLPLALTAARAGSRRLLTGTLLVCAYAPSLGGLATPIGTAPNLIGLRLLEQVTGSRPSFAAWTASFAPLAVGFTALAAGWLAWRARGAAAEAARAADGADAAAGPPVAGASTAPAPGTDPPPGVAGWGGAAPRAGAPRRPWSLAERTLVPVFVAVVLLWITPGILAATALGAEGWVKAWQARLPEPAVPLLGGLALFALPSGEPGGRRILDAGVLPRLDWSTLMLFGGGLSLGAMMFDSGLARALGEGLFRAMPLPGTFGVVLAAALMGILVSEMTSNTASAALVVPVVLALAQAAGVDPLKPALAATVGCSFGFMLPVSTPPNALVYGTGRLTIPEMVRNGALLDAAGAVLIAVWVTFVL